MDLTTIKREKAKRELTPESSTALLNSLLNGKTIVGNYNSVTYITDDAPLAREYHLCADQTNTMIHCMGADYMTMIPFYLSYSDANLLTDIKVYPQFINNTLYDNKTMDIGAITNQNHRRLFAERQSNFTSSEWPLVSFT